MEHKGVGYTALFLDELDPFVSAMIGGIIKILVWTIPAILLIKHYPDDMWISLKEMLTNKPKWFKGAPLLLLVLYPLFAGWFSRGGLEINPDFLPVDLIGPVLFVGITEEFVFRGFLLNAFLTKMRTTPAIFLNEVFFVLNSLPHLDLFRL